MIHSSELKSISSVLKLVISDRYQISLYHTLLAPTRGPGSQNIDNRREILSSWLSFGAVVCRQLDMVSRIYGLRCRESDLTHQHSRLP